MIFKVLAILVVMFLVYIIFFKKSREVNLKNKRDKKHEEITDTLEECPTCGVFISKDEAILSNGKYFCSKECLK